MQAQKILSLVVIASLLYSVFVPLSFAQEATDSADVQESTSSAEFDIAPQPELDTNATSSSIPIASTSGSAEDTLLDDAASQLLFSITPTVAPSAVLKKKPSVRTFARKHFRSDERITVIVDNEVSNDTEIKVFDGSGSAIDINLATISVSDPVVYRLMLPREFRPGRFRLKVTTSDGTTSTQDFTWGVLAINPNKSLYLPGETAHLSMAVLDETGKMVCNALLRLTITDPDGQTTVLTTREGTITVNPECQIKGYVTKPDYESTYHVRGNGGYAMTLEATTQNGQYSIVDGFEVREHVAFDVERNSATRLFPPETYPMEISVTAAEDFSGTIEEVVPGHIAVALLDGVGAYDSVIMETLPAAAELKEADIPLLGMPTDRLHPISEAFGDQIRDPLVKEKYADFGLVGHDGIDFDVPEGTAVLAVDDGVVVKADPDGDYGETIVMQHSWGKSYYGHLSTITAQVGETKQRGLPIGVSGSTGLSTAPHLHFGIKSNVNDSDNGYYGKINPFPYLSFLDSTETFQKDIAGAATPSAAIRQGSDIVVQKISWKVTLAKGQTTKIGYTYRVPNISPQFYLLGPLTFRDQAGTEIFQSSRGWQLAVDADGSGANTVNPTTGTISASGQTYTFSFDPSETMDSGGITITVPAGWSAPQGTAGTAGYTTATGNGSATVATVLNTADSATGWAEDDGDMCNTFGGDTTNKKEGSGSWYCAPTAADATDSIGFDISSSNWSSYDSVGFWTRSDQTTTDGGFTFFYDDTSTGASPIQEINVPAMTANTWTYVTAALSGTRTAVVTYGIQCNTGSNSDCGLGGTGVGRLNLDDILLGPGVPTFSGSGPWDISVRFLDLAAADTVSIVYGSGGGASGVANSASSGVHTFTTQSRTSASGTLTNISSHPTVTLSSGGPTVDQLMRHGAWFNSGVSQPFTF